MQMFCFASDTTTKLAVNCFAGKSGYLYSTVTQDHCGPRDLTLLPFTEEMHSELNNVHCPPSPPPPLIIGCLCDAHVPR